MKRKFIFLAASAAIFLCACSNQEDFLVRGEVNVDQQVGHQTDDVTASDIGTVVSEFFGGQRTRGVDYDTSAITDASGNAAIYVVNYKDNQGFLLISATKRYCPVLAYADKGNFDVSGIADSGLVDWHTETLSAIELAKQLPDDSIQKFRSMWQRYEQPQTSKALKARKRSSSDPDVMRAQTILQDSVSAWIAKGYTIFDIADGSPYAEEVKGAIYPLYEEEWERLSIGVNKPFVKNKSIPNFVETKWHQQGFFNSCYPYVDGVRPLAGCGPVAAGQIMYYYKYPVRFDWDSMPLTDGSWSASSFLLEIANNANATFTKTSSGMCETTTTIDNVCKVFNNWGFGDAIVQKHNAGKVWSEIEQGRPVYMRGNDKEDGHAWIACGGNLIWERKFTEIFTFTSRLVFDAIARVNTQENSSSYLYFNWGYGGNYDGMYIDNRLILPEGSDVVNRYDIYNIYPTK